MSGSATASSELDLTGKTVIVTGGTKGIGRVITTTFLEHGADVVICARNAPDSPVAANGHVYLTDRSGTIVVIEDAPALKIIATNDMGEGVDATPAAVGADLFVRGERHLFCVSQN